MFKKYLVATIFLTYFSVSCASASNGSAAKAYLEKDIDELTKALIIIETLRDVNRDDHFVSEDGRIYLSVTESLFNLLPKEVNGIKLELLVGTQPDGELKVAYLTFTRWSKVNEIIYVTSIAYFFGGNTGGCSYKFDLVEDKWKEQKKDCFATAS